LKNNLKFEPLDKNSSIFSPENCNSALRNMGGGSWIRKKLIPDPGFRICNPGCAAAFVKKKINEISHTYKKVILMLTLTSRQTGHSSSLLAELIMSGSSVSLLLVRYPRKTTRKQYR
jgi:hypothetical protein